MHPLLFSSWLELTPHSISIIKFRSFINDKLYKRGAVKLLARDNPMDNALKVQLKSSVCSYG